MELYQNDDMFAELCSKMYEYYRQRSSKLKERDAKREQEAGWYHRKDMLGMMLYIDNFAGNMQGVKEKIPYLKELGINAVELMPIFAFDEAINAREVNGTKLLEYWGYNTVGFFAPNVGYASSEEYNKEGLELKKLIRALHDNGIEVILDVVFNHTAEGNEQGPSFCFKGFDNNIYYMLTPDGNYY